MPYDPRRSPLRAKNLSYSQYYIHKNKKKNAPRHQELII
jgi:hypothetical protein